GGGRGGRAPRRPPAPRAAAAAGPAPGRAARPPARAGARPPAPARTGHPRARRARRPRRRSCPRRPRPRARARGGDASRACPPCYHTAVAQQACEGGLHRERTRERNRFMPPLERYARFLTGHAWTVLVAVGVATAVLAAGMGRLRDVPETPEEIAALRARLDDDPALRGLLVTPDQRAALVFLDFYEGVSGQDVFARTASLAEPYRDRPLDFYFAGEPMFVMASLEQSREVAWRIPLTFLVIAAMLLVSFRSVQGMLVPMLTATLSTLWGLGLMGWTGIVIDGWNVAVPILLIAVAAAHSAQMLKRYGEEVERRRDNRGAVIASTGSMGP